MNYDGEEIDVTIVQQILRDRELYLQSIESKETHNSTQNTEIDK